MHISHMYGRYLTHHATRVPGELFPLHVYNISRLYAVLVGGSNGDGAWRGQVTIVELIDPRPYIFQTPVHGSLIYTVIYMSDGLLTQANPNSHFTPPRSALSVPSACMV